MPLYLSCAKCLALLDITDVEASLPAVCPACHVETTWNSVYTEPRVRWELSESDKQWLATFKIAQT